MPHSRVSHDDLEDDAAILSRMWYAVVRIGLRPGSKHSQDDIEDVLSDLHDLQSRTWKRRSETNERNKQRRSRHAR